MSAFVFDFLNLKINDLKEILLFTLSINLGDTIKLGGFLAKNTFLISVDITEIYFGKFNLIRYLICWAHFFMFLITVMFGISLITFDSMFQLIDNKFFPENIKPFIILSTVGLICTTVGRFDALMAEWNGTISVFSVMYYLQEDIESKHGLTKSNHKKLTIFVIIFKAALILGSISTSMGMSLILLYISIISGRITLYILTPFLIYILWSIMFSLACGFVIGFIVIYYYLLLFSQINYKMNMIYQKSKLFLTFLHRIRLNILINKHNLVAIQISEINFTIRRSLLTFYIGLALVQVIPFNIILKSHIWFEKILYLLGLIGIVVFGFIMSYCLSELTKTAHKPYKIICKIIRKPNPLPLKWKVTFSL